MNIKEYINELNELSLNARISYGIMCLENYVMTEHKNVDFNILFEDLWKINSVEYIDSNWYYPMLEKSVASILEFDNYEDGEYEEISKDEYNKYSELYIKVREDKTVCEIIDIIIKLPEYYIYTNVTDDGIKMTEDIIKIINILTNLNVELPDISLLKCSKLSTADYTDNLDSSKLTKYLYQ